MFQSDNFAKQFSKPFSYHSSGLNMQFEKKMLIEYFLFTIIFATHLQPSFANANVTNEIINSTMEANQNSTIKYSFDSNVTSVPTLMDIKINYFQDEIESNPCSHFDSINITNGKKNPNGSITYRGITYSPNHYRTYDYIYLNQKNKTYVGNHTRGCICFYRKCVRSCCLPSQQFSNSRCINNDSDLDDELSFNVIFITNKMMAARNLLNDPVFGVTYPKHCNGILMEPELYPQDKWHLEMVLLWYELIRIRFSIYFEKMAD